MRHAALFLCLALLAAGLLPGPADQSFATEAREAARNADDLLIVDCLLPAKVRRLGRRNTFLAPRQPLKTTAAECRIRGGEHTAPDQASLATALRVWRPKAEGGDPEAQFYLGQMFEKGLGVAPDYSGAAEWYRRAAEQGHAAAQIGLGHLFERGLGVPVDPTQALAWYRRAAGLEEGLMLVGEDDYAELLAARQELDARNEELNSLRGEVEALEGELEDMRKRLETSEARSEDERRRESTLQTLLSRLRSDLESREQELTRRNQSLAALEERLGAEDREDEVVAVIAKTEAPRREIDFGSYHALVIGNSRYQHLPPLPTAAADAEAIGDLLESRYGFEVTLLLDATRYQTMTTLNELRASLTQDDNLLVYYAGHGERAVGSEIAYWQPIDAEAGSPANWIPDRVITEHLDLVPAKHVLVVADSHYAGLRTRSSIARLPKGMTDDERFHHIRLMLERRARLALTAGGPPVPHPRKATSSRFSATLREVLEDNDQVLEASEVYRKLVARLPEVGDQPIPELATLRWARNNVADFFFVPRPKGAS